MQRSLSCKRFKTSVNVIFAAALFLWPLPSGATTFGPDVTSPSFASASSTHLNYIAGGAFDDQTTINPEDKWISTVNSGWLQQDFGAGNKKVIVRYTLRSLPNFTFSNGELTGSAPMENPKDWVFEASSDGNNWTVLDRQTYQRPLIKIAHVFFNTTAYRYYRINVSSTFDGNMLSIWEMEMTEAGPSMLDNSVTTSQIQDNAVTSAKIEDGTIQLQDLDSSIPTKGDKGDPGIQGVAGADGAQGLRGQRGRRGKQGLQGLQGAQGPSGAQGLQGLQGGKGDPGIQGATGADGVQGLQGLQGDKGDPGIQGVAGADGAQGGKGDPGIQGATGVAGAQGLLGPQGPAGQPPAFRGALVRQRGRQSVPKEQFHQVSWNTEVEDIGGFFDSSSPTRFTIPAGVKRVRLTASVRWVGEAQDVGVRFIFIKKNGRIDVAGVPSTSANVLSQMSNRFAAYQTVQTFSSYPISVVQGDYLEVSLFHNSEPNQNTQVSANITDPNDPESNHEYTWFGIEVVE